MMMYYCRGLIRFTRGLKDFNKGIFPYDPFSRSIMGFFMIPLVTLYSLYSLQILYNIIYHKKSHNRATKGIIRD